VERTWFFVPFYESGCSGFKLVETSFFFFLIYTPSRIFFSPHFGGEDLPSCSFHPFPPTKHKNKYIHTHTRVYCVKNESAPH
jgi:hypothetical protein